MQLIERRKSKHGIWALLMTVFLVIGSLTGCKNESTEDKKEDQVKYLIGVSQANLTEPWRVVMNEEIKEEAMKNKDLKIIFTDAAQSSQKQIDDVEELLQQGIDLLIISPNESAALTPIVTKVYKKIPVIVLDRAIEGFGYTLYIGPDNRLIGKQAGQFVANLLGYGGGNIIEIQGLSGSPPVRDRSEGFREVIEQHPNIKIIDTIIGDWQRDQAEDKLEYLIRQYPHIDVVFAHNDPMALGAYKAITKLNVHGIQFVGVDGLIGANGGLQLVANGVLQGTFTCPTGGKEAVQYAIDILNHEKGIPKKIILKSNKITRENVFEYIASKAEPVKSKDFSKKKILLGFSQIGKEGEWREANSESVKKAALDAEIELFFLDAEQQQKDQIKAIRSFIAQKVDVIAFSPIVEAGWQEVLQEAKDAGIPVIISDRTVNLKDDSLYTTFIGADFLEEGRRAGRWLAEKMQDKETVNIVEIQGTIGSAPAIDRKNGFEEIIKDYPNFRIIRSQPGDFTRARGKEIMTSLLKEEGNRIQALYAHNDDMALGAIEAIEEYGLKPGKDIIVVSIDATKGAFKAMIAGKLNCTIECNPLLGPQLMKAVKSIVAGRQLPMRLITEEGVYSEEVARKEFPYRKY